MSRELKVHPKAQEELQSSIELYESRRPGLGVELHDHVRGIYRQIRLQPNLFPKANRTTRVALIKKFRFEIYYREQPDDTILIVSVYHACRRPGGWKYRR